MLARKTITKNALSYDQKSFISHIRMIKSHVQLINYIYFPPAKTIIKSDILELGIFKSDICVRTVKVRLARGPFL